LYHAGLCVRPYAARLLRETFDGDGRKSARQLAVTARHHRLLVLSHQGAAMETGRSRPAGRRPGSRELHEAGRAIRPYQEVPDRRWTFRARSAPRAAEGSQARLADSRIALETTSPTAR